MAVQGPPPRPSTAYRSGSSSRDGQADLPAADVRPLQENCAAAAIEGGAESFADVALGDVIRESLGSTPRLLAGVPELIFDNWGYEPAEERTCREAVLAVVSRWNGTGGH